MAREEGTRMPSENAGPCWPSQPKGNVLYVTSDRPLFGEGFDESPLAIPPTSVVPEARVEAVGRTVLAFREDGPWGDRSVLDVIATCLRYVEDSVIIRFKPFFLPRD